MRREISSGESADPDFVWDLGLETENDTNEWICLVCLLLMRMVQWNGRDWSVGVNTLLPTLIGGWCGGVMCVDVTVIVNNRSGGHKHC